MNTVIRQYVFRIKNILCIAKSSNVSGWKRLNSNEAMRKHACKRERAREKNPFQPYRDTKRLRSSKFSWALDLGARKSSAATRNAREKGNVWLLAFCHADYTGLSLVVEYPSNQMTRFVCIERSSACEYDFVALILANANLGKRAS